jgi:hypothetical protein
MTASVRAKPAAMSTIAGGGQARARWQALSALKGMSGVELSLGSGIDNFERERTGVVGQEAQRPNGQTP